MQKNDLCGCCGKGRSVRACEPLPTESPALLALAELLEAAEARRKAEEQGRKDDAVRKDAEAWLER